MKVKTSPYERAINRLAQGTPKDCDLADELEQAVRGQMKADLDAEARIAAAVSAEREACADLVRDLHVSTDVIGSHAASWVAGALDKLEAAIRARGAP